MDEYEELARYEPRTQRLVIQMQGLMQKIFNGNRGVRRKKAVQEFSVRIANIIEWQATKIQEELNEAQKQIETLNVCLDRQFEKKWKLKADYDKLELKLLNKLDKCHMSHDSSTQTE